MSDKKIKVLLCLNGDKDNNKFIIDRNGYILRYALQEAGIEYTYNYNQDYDLVHLLSINQLKAYYSYVKPDKRKPVILSLFNDDNDFKIEQLEDETSEIKTNINKVLKQFDGINTIVTIWPCQDLILNHFKCDIDKVNIPLGVKDYSKKEYSTLEKTAFRKYYRIPEDKKIVISYGEYDYSKGLDVFEAVARILPNYEFFFFGNKNGILSNSKHYEKTNKIVNLHYESSIPEELYHSLLLNTSCIFLPYRFHFDSLVLLEAMRQQIPIVSSKNPILYDLLIENKTALIGTTVEEYFNYINNIEKINLAKEAKEFADQFTIEKYAANLKSLYQKALKKGNN